MRDMKCGGLYLARRPGITGERHSCVTGPVIGAIPSDHPALRFRTGLARKLDGVLIGIGATQGKEHSTVVKSGLLQQQLGQLPEATRRKLVYENVAKLYGFPMKQ